MKKQKNAMDSMDSILPLITLENHCTLTAQSLRGGCSRGVHKIVYLAVYKGNILVIFLLLKIFIVMTAPGSLACLLRFTAWIIPTSYNAAKNLTC